MNLHRICEQAGVRLRPAADYTPSLRQPGECYCAPALKQVAERHGEAHLRLTLRLFGGTEANRMALYADAIKALASVIADPAVAARRDLVYAVDAIDLLALRRKAKGYRPAMSGRKIGSPSRSR